MSALCLHFVMMCFCVYLNISSRSRKKKSTLLPKLLLNYRAASLSRTSSPFRSPPYVQSILQIPFNGCSILNGIHSIIYNILSLMISNYNKLCGLPSRLCFLFATASFAMTSVSRRSSCVIERCSRGYSYSLSNSIFSRSISSCSKHNLLYKQHYHAQIRTSKDSIRQASRRSGPILCLHIIINRSLHLSMIINRTNWW